MNNRLRLTIAATLIFLTLAPPAIHLAFGEAIKAHRARAADRALKDLEATADAMANSN